MAVDVGPLMTAGQSRGGLVADEPGDRTTADQLAPPEAGDRLPLPEAGDPLALPEAGDRLALPEAGYPLALPEAGYPLALPEAGDPLVALTAKVTVLAHELAALARRADSSGAGFRPPATAGPAGPEVDTGPAAVDEEALDAALDAARIDGIRALELLKSAACAVQAMVTAAFAASQRSQQERAGVPRSRAGRGIPSQIGLARRESAHRGQRLAGLAHVLATEMPYTLQALARGEINEWRATVIVRETAVLSAADRATVDRELCGPGGVAATLGDAGIERAARAIGQRLDPGAAWARAQKAERERRVTIRPAPDCMVTLTAHLPVVPGVAVYAALTRAADAAIAAGHNAGQDGTPAGRGQLMSDELIRRILSPAGTALPAPGPAPGPATGPATGPGVELQLILTDTTLFGLDDHPAHLTGYGPVPAPLARRIALGHTASDQGSSSTDSTSGVGAAVRWIRRLYRDPNTDTGTVDARGTGTHPRPRRGLIAMDSRRRLFPAAIARFVVARDQFCRTPWCDALIRHIDHIDPAADGGPTSAANAQGLCQACNHAKQAPGWHQTTDDDGSVHTTTPTGHDYLSAPTLPPGSTPAPHPGAAA